MSERASVILGQTGLIGNEPVIAMELSGTLTVLKLMLIVLLSIPHLIHFQIVPYLGH